MTRKLKHLGSTSILVLAMAGSVPAMAGGTQAGSTITNTATVEYNVGSVTRTAQDNDSFVVDRAIDLTLDEVDGAATVVDPGQTGAYTTFTLQNTSNDTLDFALTLTQPNGTAGAHGGTDNFDATNVKVYVDTNNDGDYDAGTDLEVDLSSGTYFVDELEADNTKRLFVVADIDTTVVDGDLASIRLTATAREGGTAATLGSAITADTTNDVAAEDTVFADDDGPFDGLRDGADSAADDWRVSSATLSVAKTSTVIDDPVNTAAPYFLIPGATVRYCLIVRNTGTGAATGVTIGDSLPATLSLVTGSLRVGGTISDGGTPADLSDDSCNADGAAGGTETLGSPDSIEATIASLTGNSSYAVYFDATVD